MGHNGPFLHKNPRTRFFLKIKLDNTITLCKKHENSYDGSTEKFQTNEQINKKKTDKWTEGIS